MEFTRLNPQQFDRFRDFIYQQSGIWIDEQKVTLLSNRIRRRLKAGDFKDFDVYYELLTSPAGKDELAGFLAAITTNETFFFRTEKHFHWLKNDLIAEVVAQHRAGDRPAALRIWSAGCANGAEPYSIAICLQENGYRLQDWSLQVVGTDISEEMLSTARQGIFNARTVEAVSEQQRRRFFRFEPKDDLWHIRPALRKLVDFKMHNLLHKLAEPAFDCIFIRNVLIYFDRQSKEIALRNLLAALAPGGYLVVGPSEGIYDMLTDLRKVAPLVYQKVAGISAAPPAVADGGFSR
ncbi:MAG: CheR family methyltransferase [Bythopirellula sp.]